MSKLILRTATMNSGKSADLLMVNHNYKQMGFKTLLVKPAFDTRNNDVIFSRIGVSENVDILIKKEDNVYDILNQPKYDNIKCVLVDECQFLTKQQAFDLGKVVALQNKTVMAWGLKASYTGEGFEATNQLFAIASRVEQVNNIVDENEKKCCMHLKKIGDNYVFKGDNCVVGDVVGEEKYESCTLQTYFRMRYLYEDLKGNLLK